MQINRVALTVIRERSGLSLTALASAAGISTPYLCQIEGGKRQPQPDVVRRLAEALAVPIVALIAVEAAA